MTEFFTQLIESLQKEAARRPGMNVSQETLQELFTETAKTQEPPLPATAEPHFQKVPPVVRREEKNPFVPPEFSPAPPVGEQKKAAEPAPAPGTLEHLAATVRTCRGCPLCETRLNAVPGEGNPHARLMFIGEGPGADEDRQGRPFVGAAGQLLDTGRNPAAAGKLFEKNLLHQKSRTRQTVYYLPRLLCGIPERPARQRFHSGTGHYRLPEAAVLSDL